MIIDIHTHTFPEAIVDRALKSLAASSAMQYTNAGTNAGLKASMDEAGIDYSVILPVVTKPSQSRNINETACKLNETEDRLVSFAGIHPDNEDYKEILDEASKMGLQGVKLHPVFQNADIDDIRYKRIISYASELDMAVIVHGGYDVSFPDKYEVLPSKTLNMIKDVRPHKLILAHMGAWSAWEEFYEYLEVIREHKVYLDTAFSIDEPNYSDATKKKFSNDRLSMELFIKMVRTLGANYICFGTDSPWCEQKKAIDTIRRSGLTDEEIQMILGENANRLVKGRRR